MLTWAVSALLTVCVVQAHLFAVHGSCRPSPEESQRQLSATQ